MGHAGHDGRNGVVAAKDVAVDGMAWGGAAVNGGGGGGGGLAPTHAVGGFGAAFDPSAGIYAFFRRKYLLVLLVGFSNFMVPFNDVIFLPALVTIMEAFKTTPSHVAALMALPAFVCGVASLAWGPAADFAGRRASFVISALLLLGFNVGCALTPNIAALIAFRAFHGVAYGGLLVCNSAVLADVYAPAERGRWMGIAVVPALLGPIIAPPIGGALAVHYGWRAMFWAAAVCSLVLLLGTLLLLQETHHYRVLAGIRARYGDAAADIITAGEDIPKPRFDAPWKPIQYLFEGNIAPYAATAIVAQAAMVSSVILLPGALAGPPYFADPAVIGLATMPCGLGSLISSPFGGVLADWSARKLPSHPSGRMAPGAAATALVFPAVMAAYGWLLQRGAALAGVLVMSGFLGVAMCLYMPGLFSYVTILHQSRAGSVVAMIQATTHVMQGVFMQITPLAVAAMGIGPYMTLGAGLVFLLSGLSLLLIRRAVAGGTGTGPAAYGSGSGRAAAPAADAA